MLDSIQRVFSCAMHGIENSVKKLVESQNEKETKGAQHLLLSG